MAFKPFKFLGKLASSLIPGGGIIAEIIAPGKTPEQIAQGLSSLDPIAQYNRTMARPRIALSIVYVYLGGIVIQWIQQLLKVPKPEIIVIPIVLVGFAKIIVGAYIGSRGFEKIAETIFKKKKKRKK